MNSSSTSYRSESAACSRSSSATRSSRSNIESLSRLSSPTDHRAVPGLVVAATPRTGARDCLRRAWGAIRAGVRWLEDSWLGDLLAILSLFGTCYLLLLAGWVLE